MTKRSLTILIVAVLVIGFAAAAIASSMGGSDEAATHVMPNGQTMEGQGMDDGSMGEMPTTQHEMPSGKTMPGSGGSGMGSDTDGGGSMDGMDMGE